MDRLGTIAVIMTTCVREGPVGDLRLGYVEQALASLAKLRYDGDLRLHLADDGSRVDDMIKMVGWGEATREWDGAVRVTNVGGNGFGASWNKAIEDECGDQGCDLVFYLPDDWVLEGELNLTIPALILQDESIGMVRTGMVHPNLYARSVYGGPAIQYYWAIDKEKSGYAMSFRTWLTHRRFWDHYGPLPEGLDIYATERAYNERVRATEGPGIVYAGNVGLNWPWRHIGEIACGGKG